MQRSNLLIHETELPGRGVGLLKGGGPLRNLTRIVRHLVKGRPERIQTGREPIVGRFGVHQLDPLEIPCLQRQLGRSRTFITCPHLEKFVPQTRDTSDIDTVASNQPITEQCGYRTVTARGKIDPLP